MYVNMSLIKFFIKEGRCFLLSLLWCVAGPGGSYLLFKYVQRIQVHSYLASVSFPVWSCKGLRLWEHGQICKIWYNSFLLISSPCCIISSNYCLFAGPRFGGSRSHLSALDLSDAGSAVHDICLPQPLLQSPEEHQALFQHGCKKHVYKWPAAGSRWVYFPCMCLFMVYRLNSQVNEQTTFCSCMTFPSSLSKSLIKQEFPSAKPS